MASRMVGIREMRTTLRRLPQAFQEEIGDAVDGTVKAVHERGKANIASMVTRRTGTLQKYYRRSFSKKSLSGRVGYLSPTARTLAFYARFINDGTVNMEARPFHTAAVEAEREADTARMVKARDDALRKAFR